MIDVIIIGAGAAGLMCAIESAKRGRSTLIVDQSNKVGKKILMSGGGRCNFTNYYIAPDRYISHNPHFCKSALKRYTQWDFINLVEQHSIPYYEKKAGQLFCQNSAKDIVNMLLHEAAQYSVKIALRQTIHSVYKQGEHYCLKTNDQLLKCRSLVVATGGLSIPSMGSSPFGYKIAEQFGHSVHNVRAGLVPFTLHTHDKEQYSDLSGVSVECEVSCNQQSFQDTLLFTHRGLSGPAMLQISSYWQPGCSLSIKLLPQIDVLQSLKSATATNPMAMVSTVLGQCLAKRLLIKILPDAILKKTIKSLQPPDLQVIDKQFNQWLIKPNATEGYRTAEVTIGGVNCDGISSKTFESLNNPGLYFIGEVLDVTGWLGGYNFQWAWSSGWAAGQVV